jgi:site-specific DNA-adenine methylase
MKTTIIEKLDLLLATTSEYNSFQITLINSIKQDLMNEWNEIDNYTEQIKQVLDMDVTYELLNNIKIR